MAAKPAAAINKKPGDPDQMEIDQIAETELQKFQKQVSQKIVLILCVRLPFI